jgi:hypothetical protein
VRALRLASGADGADELAAVRIVGLPPPRPVAAARPARRRTRSSPDAASESEASEEEEEAAADAEGAAMEEEVVAASMNGIINRFRLQDISVQSRQSRGTRLLKLDEGDKVRTAAILPGAADAE